MSISTVRRCEHCTAILPPMARCDGEALPKESLAQIVLETVEFAGDDGRKHRGRMPRVCLERYRGDDGRVHLPAITA